MIVSIYRKIQVENTLKKLLVLPWKILVKITLSSAQKVFQSILSPSITIIIIIAAVILIFVIITIPIILIILRKSITKKEENPIPLQCKNPKESSEDVIVSYKSSLNKKQSKSVIAPVYSVVSKNAAKNIGEENTGNIDENKKKGNCCMLLHSQQGILG